jgi:hypothetical protein
MLAGGTRGMVPLRPAFDERVMIVWFAVVRPVVQRAPSRV